METNQHSFKLFPLFDINGKGNFCLLISFLIKILEKLNIFLQRQTIFKLKLSSPLFWSVRTCMSEKRENGGKKEPVVLHGGVKIFSAAAGAFRARRAAFIS